MDYNDYEIPRWSPLHEDYVPDPVGQEQKRHRGVSHEVAEIKPFKKLTKAERKGYAKAQLLRARASKAHIEPRPATRPTTKFGFPKAPKQDVLFEALRQSKIQISERNSMSLAILLRELYTWPISPKRLKGLEGAEFLASRLAQVASLDKADFHSLHLSVNPDFRAWFNRLVESCIPAEPRQDE